MTKTPTSAYWKLAICCCALLMGCAAPQAYREGQSLLSQGKTAAGLSKLQEASKLEPGSVEYRLAYLNARERSLADLQELAEQASAQNKLVEAEKHYLKMLELDASNVQARSGLAALRAIRRQDAWYREAEVAWAKKDSESASRKLRAVLAEAPAHERAQKLLQMIEDKQSASVDEAKLAATFRKPITIEFKDAPLRTVFEVIAKTSGLNFIFDKDVRTEQKATLFLRNKTVASAVNLLLLTNQLEQRVLDDNSVLIYPNTQAKQKDYQALLTRSFYLSNADAKSVANSLKSIAKARDVFVDEKNNLLIMRDSPEAIRHAERLVALQDMPEPEVMLEVEILEVKRARLMELGVSFPDKLTLSPIATPAGATLTLNDLRNLNGAHIGAAIGSTTINLRNQDGDTNILANPRIRSRNREKAKILIGSKLPVITSTSTASGFVSDSVNYVDVGLKLEVEPIIYPDDEVVIKTGLEVSNILNKVQSQNGTQAYEIGTRTANTTLRLRDGENQVLAGLINDEDRKTANQLPWLGELPLLGRLLGSQLSDKSKTEIVLSVTPRIIRNIRRPDAAALEFESGTESNLRSYHVESAAVVPSSDEVKPAASPVANPRDSTAAATANSTQSPNAATSSSPTPTAAPALADDAAPPVPVEAGATPLQLNWRGPSQLKPGQRFTLELSLQGEAALNELALGVGFDPRALQVLEVARGELSNGNNGQLELTTRIEPGGLIRLTGKAKDQRGINANGVLARINFRVLAQQGEVVVPIFNGSVLGPDGQSQPIATLPSHSMTVVP